MEYNSIEEVRTFVRNKENLFDPLTYSEVYLLTSWGLQKGFTRKTKYYSEYLLDFNRNSEGHFTLEVERVYRQIVLYSDLMIHEGLENFAFVINSSEPLRGLLSGFSRKYGVQVIISVPGMVSNSGRDLPRHLIFFNSCSLLKEIQGYREKIITSFYSPQENPTCADYFLIKGDYNRGTWQVYFELFSEVLNRLLESRQ